MIVEVPNIKSSQEIELFINNINPNLSPPEKNFGLYFIGGGEEGLSLSALSLDASEFMKESLQRISDAWGMNRSTYVSANTGSDFLDGKVEEFFGVLEKHARNIKNKGEKLKNEITGSWKLDDLDWSMMNDIRSSPPKQDEKVLVVFTDILKNFNERANRNITNIGQTINSDHYYWLPYHYPKKDSGPTYSGYEVNFKKIYDTLQWAWNTSLHNPDIGGHAGNAWTTANNLGRNASAQLWNRLLRIPELQHLPVIPDYRPNLNELDERLNEGTRDASASLRPKLENKRNQAIEYLLNSGTDFIDNMFDVMLICSRGSGRDGSFTNFFEELYKSKFIGGNLPPFLSYGNIFMVRATTIDVPQSESESFDLKFGIHAIKKVRTKVKYERRADLKVLMDEPLYFMGIFNMISNNNRIVFDGISERNRYPKGFATFSTQRIIKENILSKNIRIDILIKHQKLMNNPEVENLRNNKGINGWKYDTSLNRTVINHAGLSSAELPLWWFEDVKFLGQGDDLVFNRDNAEKLDLTFPFLFKRCIKIDRQFRHGTEQTIQFDGKPIDGIERFIDERLVKESFYEQSNQEWYYDKSN